MAAFRLFTTSYFEIEGLHCWPGVLNTECSEKYLAEPHRHIFKFRVKVPVTHTDRDVEFIELAHKIKSKLLSEFPGSEPYFSDFGDWSCEALAEWVLENFTSAVACEVTEDGESGALVERL